MAMTPLTTPTPTRTDKATFSSRMDLTLSELPRMVTEANILQADVTEKQEIASAAAVTATEQAAIATAQAGLATTNGAAQVSLAAAQAEIAAAAAAAAVVGSGGTSVSTSTMTIGTGPVSFTIEINKDFVVGMSVKVASTAGPTNWMHGDITAFDSGTGAITVNVTSTQGAGAGLSAWTISVSAPGSMSVSAKASQAEAEAATSDITYMTPLKTGHAIAALTSMTLRVITANAAVTVADKAKMLHCNGTLTLAFAGVAALTDKFYCYVKNIGSGEITLGTNGTETVDGLAGYVIYPGECRLFLCDGVEIVSQIIFGGRAIYLANGSWVQPPGVVNPSVALMSGGGGGGSGASGLISSAASSMVVRGGSGGGTGFGRVEKIVLDPSDAGASIPVAVGSGGAGGSAVTASSANVPVSGVSGGSGGTSSFGSFISNSGGAGGAAGGGNYAASATISSAPGGNGGQGASIRAYTINTSSPSLDYLAWNRANTIYRYLHTEADMTRLATPGSGCGQGSSGLTYSGGVFTSSATYKNTLSSSNELYNLTGSTLFGLSFSRSGGTGAGCIGYSDDTLASSGTLNVIGTNGADATGYGGGGSGGTAALSNGATYYASGAGGDGAPGFVIVWWEA